MVMVDGRICFILASDPSGTDGGGYVDGKDGALPDVDVLECCAGYARTQSPG